MSQTLKQINQELDQIEEALDGLTTRKSEIESVLPGVQSSFSSWSSAEQTRREAYNQAKQVQLSGHCQQYTLLKKRRDCQAQVDANVTTTLSKLNEAASKKRDFKASLDSLNSELASVNEKIDSRKLRQKTLMEQSNDIGDRDMELASQGTTSDALSIVAQAESEAEQIKAQAEAQGTIEERRSLIASKEEQQQVILYVGIGVGVLILIAGVLIIRKKFKKNKKK